MSGADQGDDAIREEFLAEANEIVESLSRDLLVLDQGANERTPELINEIFRGVHTLKGMAGMFGFQQVGAVAHELENLLDDLRLGRVDLSRNVLDVLFSGVESFQRLLSSEGEVDETEASAVSKAIEKVTFESRQPKDPLKVYDLDASLLSVLTEYEEHRLRTNILEGIPLYRYRVSYPLTSIDVALEELKKRAKPLGEIITYLPSVGAADSDAIDLEILFASRASEQKIIDEIARDAGHVEAVGRARGSLVQPPSQPPLMDTVPPAPRLPDGADATVAGLAVPPADGGADLASLRSVGHSVRVDIRKLDHLMNIVSELSVARGGVERIAERLRSHPSLRSLALELYRLDRSLERNLGVLQEGILGVRMVPLKQLFERVARGVRQVAREHGKDVRFVVTGAETELDKLIVEELSDPLMHIVRNSVDHGVERPSDRERIGKPAAGTLAVNAYQKGNHVVIEVEDDGSGIDVVKIAAAASRAGFHSVDALREMSRDELLDLIFVPGLSTATVVSDTSGRGVGMDVVKHNIGKLGGIIDVQSEFGTGTKFTITLPITLAIIRVLAVSVAARIYSLPLTAVREAFVFEPGEVHVVDGKEVVTLRGSTLVLSRLERQLGLSSRLRGSSRQFVVVVAAGSRSVGFVVDELLGQQDVVIKALGESLSSIRCIAGAAEIGGGDVSLVLDVLALMEESLAVLPALLPEAPDGR